MLMVTTFLSTMKQHWLSLVACLVLSMSVLPTLAQTKLDTEQVSVPTPVIDLQKHQNRMYEFQVQSLTCKPRANVELDQKISNKTASTRTEHNIEQPQGSMTQLERVKSTLEGTEIKNLYLGIGCTF